MRKCWLYALRWLVDRPASLIRNFDWCLIRSSFVLILVDVRHIYFNLISRARYLTATYTYFSTNLTHLSHLFPTSVLSVVFRWVLSSASVFLEIYCKVFTLFCTASCKMRHFKCKMHHSKGCNTCRDRIMN